MITEKSNIRSENIDRKTTEEILKIMNEEDKSVPLAVEKEIKNIVKAVDEVIKSFKNGGRLIYIGAGTSGRLGVLDASECPPTFSTDRNQVIAIIAGGKNAMFEAVEGAEDDEEAAIVDLKAIDVNNKDVVIGITASGNTPYTVSAIKYSKSIGCTTVGISCNLDSKIKTIADIAITPIVGPEVIAGSTRLKAGSAQKLVLNMISTASMIGIGKVYNNYMVDLSPSNTKLRDRAKRIIIETTGVDEKTAYRYLLESEYKPKVAIIMIKTGLDSKSSQDLLNKYNDSIYQALEHFKREEV
jgi:N-acetylmuramic acid 6-phosphate etherase